MDDKCGGKDLQMISAVDKDLRMISAADKGMDKMADTRTDIKSLTYEKLSAFVAELGEPAYRAKQIYEWMHVKGVSSFDGMTNLPKGLRARLTELCDFTCLEAVRIQQSKEDGTRKYLFALSDGKMIESVLMRYHHGNSVCVSSQVGCRMGCRFCASTLNGVERGLTPGEMLDQIYRISADTNERVSNVVIMGMGEPLDNYEAVVRFIRMLSDEHGLNISGRNITLSTCGLVPGIYDLADEGLTITLAVSLHAATQEKREKLMPVAKTYPLPELMEACRYYYEKTGRRETFEYAMIAGENDGEDDVAGLASLLDGMHAHINLIPVNPVVERGFVPPDRRAAENFSHRLEKYGINVTIRRSMGRDIDGACGQLRLRNGR